MARQTSMSAFFQILLGQHIGDLALIEDGMESLSRRVFVTSHSLPTLGRQVPEAFSHALLRLHLVEFAHRSPTSTRKSSGFAPRTDLTGSFTSGHQLADRTQHSLVDFLVFLFRCSSMDDVCNPIFHSSILARRSHQLRNACSGRCLPRSRGASATRASISLRYTASTKDSRLGK